MSYVVYIVECSDGSFYTGIAIDVERRMMQHNGELSGGAKYTQSRRPVKLMYSESCESRRDAQKREYEIRKLSHFAKKQLGM